MLTLVSPPRGGTLGAPDRRDTGGGARQPTESLLLSQCSWRGPISPSSHLLTVNVGASGVDFGNDCMTTAVSGAARLHLLTRKRGGDLCAWAASLTWPDDEPSSKTDRSPSTSVSLAAKSKSMSHLKCTSQNN